jgi:hypothetical protein
MKTKDMILVNGVWVCPKCLERKFKEIREPHSYKCTLKDCDVTEDGMFKFTYVCDNCNINIVEYDDMKRRL